MEEITEEKGLSLADIWNIFKKNILIVVISTIIGTLLSGIYAFGFNKPMYRSEGTVIVQIISDTSSKTPSYNDLVMSFNIVGTAAKFLRDTSVLELVQEDIKTNNKYDLTIKEIKSGLKITQQVDYSGNKTLYVEVAFTSRDPKMSRVIVDSVMTQAIALANSETYVSVFKNALYITSNAGECENVATSTTKLLILGFAGGFVIGIVITYVKALTNNKVNTKEELQESVNIEVLGSVTKKRGK